MNNEITNKVNLVIIIVGLFLGVTLGLFLLFNKSDRNKANRYLGLLVLLSLAYFLVGFLYRFDLLEEFPYAIGWTELINPLIGPLTFFYVKSCTTKDFKFQKLHLLHFTPFFLLVLSNAPELISGAPEKIAAFVKMVETRVVDANKPMQILQSIHVIIYFFFSIKILLQYRQHLNDNASSIDRSLYRWILIFIAIHALPVVALIFSFVIGSFGDFIFTAVLLSFFIFSLAVYLAILLKPELFHTFPHQMPEADSVEQKNLRYESSNLQEELKEKYRTTILTHLEQEKPYLEPEYTLSQLSEQTRIPKHYVSQVINEKLNCNFLELINGYRISEAKHMLTSGDHEHFTILAIAFEVGFNSKSAFYSAFKSQVGMTPSKYKNSTLVRA